MTPPRSMHMVFRKCLFTPPLAPLIPQDSAMGQLWS